MKILTLNDKLTFGKYRTWTIDQVLDTEPSYIEWAITERIFVLNEEADIELMKALERFRRER